MPWIRFPERIQESVEELSASEKQHRGTSMQVRLQFLRLLKSGEKRSVRQASRAVGYSRQQGQRWWNLYKEGGLPSLLSEKPQGGSESQMTPQAWAGLTEEMQAGRIRRLREARRYLEEHWNIVYRSDEGIGYLFRQRGVKWKTGRRRHRKAKTDEQEEFKQTLEERAREAGVTRLWAMDEGRFGLKGWQARCWCPRGVRPPWIVDDRYEWMWLYAAVEPETGDSFFCFLPRVDGDGFERFLAEWHEALTERGDSERIGVVLDNSPAHVSGAVGWPEAWTPLRLPAYSPELNPAEQVFRRIRAELANVVFDTLDSLMEAITGVLREFWEAPSALVKLTGYPWWRNAAKYIAASPT